MENIEANKIPEHVAIIMDGNGRWAKKRSLKRIFGHRSALDAIRSTVEGATEIGVKFLTLYAFSTENWSRPQDEVDGLMEILVSAIEKEVPSLHKNNVRMQTIGNIEAMSTKVQEKLRYAIEYTADNKGLTLVLALNYGSREEITCGIKHCLQDVLDKKIDINAIDQNVFSSYLQTKDMPNPELIIRTSGEERLSNFLLWQAAYSEFYFTEVLWPDFRKQHLFESIEEYQKRERRFGKTSEQLNKK